MCSGVHTGLSQVVEIGVRPSGHAFAIVPVMLTTLTMVLLFAADVTPVEVDLADRTPVTRLNHGQLLTERDQLESERMSAAWMIPAFPLMTVGVGMLLNAWVINWHFTLFGDGKVREYPLHPDTLIYAVGGAAAIVVGVVLLAYVIVNRRAYGQRLDEIEEALEQLPAPQGTRAGSLLPPLMQAQITLVNF